MSESTVQKSLVPPAASPLVYVVDEDEPVRDSFETLLPTAGYRAKTFATADEFHSAWPECHKTDPPHCMVVCVELPDGDGRELCKKVTTEKPNFPVVLMTRHDDQKLAANFTAFGACALLIRPFLPAELLETLANLIGM